LIGLVAVTSACSPAPADLVAPRLAAAASASDTVGERNKVLVNTYLDAVHRGDTVAMGTMLTDDFVGYGLGVKDRADKQKTLDGVKRHWDEYKYGGKRYSRIEAIALTTTVDGGRGRGKGDWVFEWGDLAIDYPASQEYGEARTATFAFHAAFRVTNGKIDTITTYFNHEDIMRQLGFKYLSPAQQAKKAAHGLVLE
jgi:ketosteroid isomerase-like protein